MHPNERIESILRGIKGYMPLFFFRALAPIYHYFLALASALYYRFPSRKIFVVAVTGTNGKTTVTELVNAFLEEAGFETALSNTLRFKVGKESVVNVFKMTIPGRFFLQRFLREAVNARCRYAVIELTSEGARQGRHLFTSLDALIFMNLTPEHIESHGSFSLYRDAKRKLARSLAHSGKRQKYMVANADDKEGKNFLRIAGWGGAEKIPFSLADAEPYTFHENGFTVTIGGETMESSLQGVFNISNVLAAVAFARSQGVSLEAIKRALARFKGVPGRVEKIELRAATSITKKQNFSVYVDYAHTPDALSHLYGAFPHARKICVLGATGGGRDTWKRPVLGEIAEKYCEEIIITDEDPYDEDPEEIMNAVAAGGTKKTPTLMRDRRAAIEEGIRRARTGDVVLITGKGTDPYIMGPRGTKTPWSDAEIAREALKKILR